MPSSDAQDGWCVRRPDGSMVVGSFTRRKGFWKFQGFDKSEKHLVVVRGATGGWYSPTAAELNGYQLVPVRLVEVDAEIEQPEQPKPKESE